eukprot:scaffold223477_cov27-Tisochrysis_lutea.AAC.2
MADDERFDDEFFMVWLLPPIIFAAGYNMNVPAFFDSLAPTMLLAFGGTLLSAATVGTLVYFAGQAGYVYELSLLASLFFGSLVSATDPVTVLAIFKVIGVREDIFSIIFGESVLNDAVAIVLARTILSFNMPGAEVSLNSCLQAVLVFCSIFLGSMLIGMLSGALSALLFKALRLSREEDKVALEAALCFAFPWSSYYAAEALQLSGIVAILFCGIVMATYTRVNLSHHARELTTEMFECLASIAEAFVFNYLGMAFFTFPILRSDISWRLALITLLACFVGRLHVFFFLPLTNAVRRRIARQHAEVEGKSGTSDAAHRAQRIMQAMRDAILTPAHAFVLWFSGLRGGVAFAIAAAAYGDSSFPAPCEATHTCTGEELSPGLAILQATLLIAVFTIVAFGGPIKDVAVCCDVIASRAPSEDHHEGLDSSPRVASPRDGTPLNDPATCRSDSRSNGDLHHKTIRARWRRINEAYILPRLTVGGARGGRHVGNRHAEVEELELKDEVQVSRHRPQHGLLAAQENIGWETGTINMLETNDRNGSKDNISVVGENGGGRSRATFTEGETQRSEYFEQGIEGESSSGTKRGVSA